MLLNNLFICNDLGQDFGESNECQCLIFAILTISELWACDSWKSHPFYLIKRKRYFFLMAF